MRRLLPFLWLLASCKPDFAERASEVNAPRILAIRSEPAEAKPGETVTYTALLADPPAGGAIAWSFCATPKLLGENGSVSAECAKDGVVPIGASLDAISAELPQDACSLFGPEAPPGQFRPRDPDASGGYYQPVRAAWGPVMAFGFSRITCNLPNAAADVTAEFSARYVKNENPIIAGLAARVSGRELALDALPVGATVTFTVAWPAEAAETYVLFDRASQTVVERREEMSVSWFVSGGELGTDRTGRASSDTSVFTENSWRAPSSAEPVTLWIVLRDDRGGTAFATYALATSEAQAR